jgi:hypothetical protein
MLAVIQFLRAKSFLTSVGNGLSSILLIFIIALLAQVLPKNVFGPSIVILAIYGILEALGVGMVMNIGVRNLAQSSYIYLYLFLYGCVEFSGYILQVFKVKKHEA